MKIPIKIKVGAVTFKVKYDKLTTDHTNTWGITDHDKQLIILDPAMQSDRQGEVFLHELMHAAFAQSGLAWQFQEKQPVDEETIINALARSLYMIIKDNSLVL